MIEIINLTNFAVDKKFFLAVAKIVLKGENKELENLSIAFVSPGEIRKLNREYRKKDKPTDVLSFEKKIGFKNDFLEVVICPKAVMEKAKSSKLSKKDLARVLVHGILHTLGHDHEDLKQKAQKMKRREKQYLSKIINE